MIVSFIDNDIQLQMEQMKSFNLSLTTDETTDMELLDEEEVQDNAIEVNAKNVVADMGSGGIISLWPL